ncbi:MAG: hypothetical protein TQ37_03525 [Candidatus Synechococcus spongiarum 15L]|uniref:Uncharacterized protein n=1 Tax=Candidatus Synechococcus spongiarum 15L TaxID=1608419 RepID=A0A0G8AXJ7_9SYNE|nr:MAG: hypothetical protein TQ37_03525 [Candidatus Synechococcus spongiarum 15L]
MAKYLISIVMKESIDQQHQLGCVASFGMYQFQEIFLADLLVSIFQVWREVQTTPMARMRTV